MPFVGRSGSTDVGPAVGSVSALPQSPVVAGPDGSRHGIDRADGDEPGGVGADSGEGRPGRDGSDDRTCGQGPTGSRLRGSQSAADEVEQSVAVVDRTTGALVAENNGGQVFNSESILKLFTAAFYLTESEGPPESWLVDDLRTMITTSDNGIQTDLWDYEIIPTIAERYDLADTSNGYAASPESWGSDRTTATDQALFLYRMSVDPEVGPLLMTWMAATTPTAADGFDQSFGLAALSGDHGSKQGWSDPDWSPANLHSVGWTGRYFVAILQTSPTATYATMRATSTTTAKSLAEVVVASVDKSSTTSARHVNRGEFGRLIRHSFENSGIGQGLGIGIAVSVHAKDSRGR